MYQRTWICHHNEGTVLSTDGTHPLMYFRFTEDHKKLYFFAVLGILSDKTFFFFSFSIDNTWFG